MLVLVLFGHKGLARERAHRCRVRRGAHAVEAGGHGGHVTRERGRRGRDCFLLVSANPFALGTVDGVGEEAASA